MSSKEKFLEIYNNNIKREGADKLLEYILKTDFFTAPASTNFHSNYKGGLCDHSLKVYERFKRILNSEYGEKWTEKVSEETVAVVALLHDICKVDFYKEDFRNVKDETGAWIKKPYFSVEDKLPYGHGEKSVYILSGFLRLTRDEAMAINWHMGGFDQRVMGGSYSLSSAFYNYPLAFLFHMADVQATYLDETITK